MAYSGFHHICKDCNKNFFSKWDKEIRCQDCWDKIGLNRKKPLKVEKK